MNKTTMLTVVVLAVVLGDLAQAQGRTVPVRTNAQQARKDVTLLLDLSTLEQQRSLALSDSDGLVRNSVVIPTVKVGEFIKACFEATRDGYVTLWSQGGEQPQPTLIYPNYLSHSGANARAEQVTAGQRVCVGDDDDFRLKVTPPLGEAEVYLHWTPTEGEQLGQEDYPSIGRSGALRESSGANALEADADSYASTSLRYRVVE